MKVEMNAWLMMAAKYRAKTWLHNLEPSDFAGLVEFILVDKIGLKIPTGPGEVVKPPWGVLLASKRTPGELGTNSEQASKLRENFVIG